MKSILITGCNRGIGFGFIKYLSENCHHLSNIFATCRNPDNAKVSTKKNSNFRTIFERGLQRKIS